MYFILGNRFGIIDLIFNLKKNKKKPGLIMSPLDCTVNTYNNTQAGWFNF